MKSGVIILSYLSIVTYSLTLGSEVSSTGQDADGYFTTGASYVTSALGCLRPTYSEHLQLHPDKELYEDGSTVKFSCTNSSRILTGSVTSMCDVISNWTRAPPVCEGLICQLEEHLIATSATPYRGESLLITLSCAAGFELVGNITNVCTEQGEWHDELARCLETCGDPLVPLHGQSHPQCTYEGCDVTYVCDNGYVLEGDNSSVCASSAWVIPHAVPTCVEKPTDSTINDNDSTNSASQETMTSSPEKMTSPSIANTTPQMTSQSSGSTSSCPHTSVDNGLSQINENSVVYSCLPGFRLVGDAVRHCQADGTWSGQAPECIQNEPCPEPPRHRFSNFTIDRGVMDENQLYPYRTQVTYTCIQNASMTFVLTCDQRGEWAGEEPRCLDPNINLAPDLGDNWKQLFLDNRHWIGSYRYWGQPIRFTLWVVDQEHMHENYLDLLFDDTESKFILQAHYSARTLTFHMTRLLTPSERFLHQHQWAFTGHVLRAEHGKWWFYSSWFNHHAFDQLHMTPQHVEGKIPGPGDDIENNTTALALGVVIAVLLVCVAGGIAAYYARAHALSQRQGHRATTSFENPVYDYANAAKDSSDTEPMAPQET